jgi:hypothetical protein
VSNQPCGNSEQTLGADRAALELFQIAALLLSDEDQAVTAVESAITESEIDPCDDPEGTRRVVHQRAIAAAIRLVAAGKEDQLSAPENSAELTSCLEDDDLSFAGISPSQLDDMIQGAGRERMRQWLEQLPPAMRIVFVLRAVSGLTGKETANLLIANAGPSAGRWTAEGVSATFRQALCSLTSLLVQSVQISEVAN